jgi:hypothetical protein
MKSLCAQIKALARIFSGNREAAPLSGEAHAIRVRVAAIRRNGLVFFPAVYGK